MADRLPVVYALIVVAEILGLSWLYATDPPSSSAPMSVALGWAGLASMVIMLVYSVARRVKALRNIARLRYWLHFHIWLGVQGVVFVLFHSAHLFTKETIHWLNPGTVNLLAVLIVFSSGIFGRYLYSLMPRTIGGQQMMASEVEAEIAAEATELPPAVSALWADAPKAAGFADLVRADLRTRSALSALKQIDISDELRALAKRRIQLERRLAAWTAADSLFRRWMVLHRPLAAIMYVLSVVHVVLSYMFTPGI